MIARILPDLPAGRVWVAAGSDWVGLPAGHPSLAVVGAAGARSRGRIGGGAWARWVIARRHPDNPAERDYYLAWGPPPTPVEELVRVPGARWRVEEAIKLAKSAAGMADYEVRSFRGWYRHITLAQLAAAFLAVQAAAEGGAGTPDTPAAAERGAPDDPADTGGIVPVALTACEIRRLLVVMAPQLPPELRIWHGLHWSFWRRCHQAVARACHRRRNRARAARATTAPPKPRTTAAGLIYS